MIHEGKTVFLKDEGSVLDKDKMNLLLSRDKISS